MIRTEHVLYFIIYGFLGWIYESLYYSIQFKKRVNAGFLHICFCPIYGLVCLLNIVFFSGEKSDAKIFFLSIVVVSIVEYIVSWVLEKRFNKRWWDYSELPFNINGRISFFSSLAFGILSLVQLRILHPFILRLISGVSEHLINIFLILSSAVIILDFVRTVINMSDEEDKRLWFVNEEPPGMQRAITKFNEKTHKASERCNFVYTRIKDRFWK